MTSLTIGPGSDSAIVSAVSSNLALVSSNLSSVSSTLALVRPMKYAVLTTTKGITAGPIIPAGTTVNVLLRKIDNSFPFGSSGSYSDFGVSDTFFIENIPRNGLLQVFMDFFIPITDITYDGGTLEIFLYVDGVWRIIDKPIPFNNNPFGNGFYITEVGSYNVVTGQDILFTLKNNSNIDFSLLDHNFSVTLH